MVPKKLLCSFKGLHELTLYSADILWLLFNVVLELKTSIILIFFIVPCASILYQIMFYKD